MVNVYDMVTGEWLAEQNRRPEATVGSSCPSRDAETLATQLASHPPTDSRGLSMPADLAVVQVDAFLKRQAGSS